MIKVSEIAGFLKKGADEAIDAAESLAKNLGASDDAAKAFKEAVEKAGGDVKMIDEETWFDLVDCLDDAGKKELRETLEAAGGIPGNLSKAMERHGFSLVDVSGSLDNLTKGAGDLAEDGVQKGGNFVEAAEKEVDDMLSDMASKGEKDFGTHENAVAAGRKGSDEKLDEVIEGVLDEEQAAAKGGKQTEIREVKSKAQADDYAEQAARNTEQAARNTEEAAKYGKKTYRAIKGNTTVKAVFYVAIGSGIYAVVKWAEGEVEGFLSGLFDNGVTKGAVAKLAEFLGKDVSEVYEMLKYSGVAVAVLGGVGLGKNIILGGEHRIIKAVASFAILAVGIGSIKAFGAKADDASVLETYIDAYKSGEAPLGSDSDGLAAVESAAANVRDALNAVSEALPENPVKGVRDAYDAICECVPTGDVDDASLCAIVEKSQMADLADKLSDEAAGKVEGLPELASRLRTACEACPDALRKHYAGFVKGAESNAANADYGVAVNECLDVMADMQATFESDGYVGAFGEGGTCAEVAAIAKGVIDKYDDSDTIDADLFKSVMADCKSAMDEIEGKVNGDEVMVELSGPDFGFNPLDTVSQMRQRLEAVKGPDAS